jgi:hypothetical protein
MMLQYISLSLLVHPLRQSEYLGQKLYKLLSFASYSTSFGLAHMVLTFHKQGWFCVTQSVSTLLNSCGLTVILFIYLFVVYLMTLSQ